MELGFHDFLRRLRRGGGEEISLVLKPKIFYSVTKAHHQTRWHCISVKRPDNITRPSVTMSCRLLFIFFFWGGGDFKFSRIFCVLHFSFMSSVSIHSARQHTSTNYEVQSSMPYMNLTHTLVITGLSYLTQQSEMLTLTDMSYIQHCF